VNVLNLQKMAVKTSPRQRRTMGRVMHEFAHGELKSGPGGKGGKVKNRRQAIAIALSEAGASSYSSDSENKRHFEQSKEKEAHGDTAQQAAEGKDRIGASGKKESSSAMQHENAGGQETKSKAGNRSRKAKKSQKRPGSSKQELYQQARDKGIKGRSKMSATQLKSALRRAR
jgi:DNA mismatch repair ATPase MutL